MNYIQTRKPEWEGEWEEVQAVQQAELRRKDLEEAWETGMEENTHQEGVNACLSYSRKTII